MSSIGGKASGVGIRSYRARMNFRAPSASVADARLAAVHNIRRLSAVALAAASLAACAQSSVATRTSGFSIASHPAAQHHERTASFLTHEPVVTHRRPPFAPSKPAADTQMASQGLASFYTEGTRTASGEKFDAHELTAAHPTLPFGTRLRVTNVATGRSVTVRVNDRGPYVPGRVVDVSYSAAESLGMVGRGVAKVKLDVVQ
jgi:rare lipoprotein A